MVHIPAKFRRKYSNAFLSYSAKTKRDGRTDERGGGGGRFNISRHRPSGDNSARREIIIIYRPIPIKNYNFRGNHSIDPIIMCM